MRPFPFPPAASPCALSVPRETTRAPLSIVTWNPSDLSSLARPIAAQRPPAAGTGAAASRPEARPAVDRLAPGPHRRRGHVHRRGLAEVGQPGQPPRVVA